ncbi:hypothetical protein GGS23DRAFT_593027 [Durotheca rogersii]|uniref:uncharacterized protein n=1 Tax=Durotheca rogersii TaxID=419775 RepID=UPI00221EC374|nr:uncharacterized protein GGS23DRAFT_593027 [Durotheca rogersii]KAI5867742.1 hypothetical protein GGS23DRAFT_593027 [Durotheca rogersii]
MASRIPPLLDPYLRLPPEASLVLLTGVLGSTTNWLVQRYLQRLLAASAPPPEDEAAAVVLASFLRGHAFWRDGAARLGVDLDALAARGRFVFVDGLTRLFRDAAPSGAAIPPPSASELPAAAGPTAQRRVLSAPTLQRLRRELDDAVAQVRRTAPDRPVVLVADQLDLLLAASGDEISSAALRETLLSVREGVHSCVVTLAADEPLMAAQTTSLEQRHAAFAVALAHDAHLVVSLRGLDTGAARDVSGVLRVTPGGSRDDADGEVEERELLYFVASDGGLRVSERSR